MKIKLLTIVFLFFAINVASQSIMPANKPKLVVVIVVDGLQSTHLSALWNRFENGGFKRIISQGFTSSNVLFDYVSKDCSSDYASIFTGSTPSKNGIINKNIFSVLDDDLVSIVDDARFHGIGTYAGRSPKNLATLTFTDVLKFTSPKSKVISIGLTPESAIIAGGHSADATVWIDTDAMIATSDYYKRMPTWAAAMNNANTIRNYLKAKWNPLAALHTYIYPSLNLTSDSYFYAPDNSKSTNELVENFRKTPSANSAVRDLSISAIRDERLGKDDFVDILCLNFNVLPLGQNFAEFNSAEKEDIYLNLDRDLKMIFQTIEQYVGFNNCLVVTTGTQTEKFSQNTLAQSKVETGTFEGKRSMALLNSYLMSKYGQGRWILSYYGGQIMLNHALAEKNNVDLEKMQNDIVTFITSLQGVQAAFAASDIRRAASDESDVMVRLKNSYFQNRSGDVSVILYSGWQEVNIDNKASTISSVSPSYAPLIIYGTDISTQKQNSNIKITDIAPTICNILQIPYPSDCIGKAVYLMNN
ncbi:MAG: alkaline phosphatase family protein [Prevotellaceae bacterium]|jgi:hypothetical protein|nr:alkaline phosphatase family protein [Prevotellaceae bacterium]